MLDLRDRYVIPVAPDGAEAIELRAFTHGLMPRTVPAMMEAFVRDWQTRGVDAWNEVPNHWAPGSGRPVGWWTLPEFLGDEFIAPLLGARAGTCIHQPNVHWTVSCLLSCEEPFAGGRTEIVCSQLDFPSVLHTVQRLNGMIRTTPVVLPPGPDGLLDVDRLVEAVSERTAMVFVSHVGFTSGQLVSPDELHAIGEAARRHGALFCADGYHAACTMPVAVDDIGADVYFGGLLKEGSGSSGNAYLYVREDLDLKPRLGGWFSEGEPFAFDLAATYHSDVRRRFLSGTSAVASMYHAVEGVRLLLDAGLERVRQHSLELTTRAIERAEAAGISLRSPSDPDRRGAMVILDIPRADAMSAWLKTRGVYTDSRQGRYLRLAPFVWNTAEEVDRAFELIAEGIRTGTHLAGVVTSGNGPVT